MEQLLQMGWTAGKHTQLADYILSAILHKIKNNIFTQNWFLSGGTTRVIHTGELLSGTAKFIDINNISEEIHFSEYRSVEPDILLFSTNKYMTNKKRSYFAGYPNLVIELWSNANTSEERNEKFNLYSLSPTTEHWYIDKPYITVDCWLGNNKIATHSLHEKLATVQGITIDVHDMVQYLQGIDE
ncbi:MAG: Uma2 family endonuclease [Firmicutes bacterium]|nr:Uma2 family endonuclease [Bacillota bacterium]